MWLVEGSCASGELQVAELRAKVSVLSVGATRHTLASNLMVITTATTKMMMMIIIEDIVATFEHELNRRLSRKVLYRAW